MYLVLALSDVGAQRLGLLVDGHKVKPLLVTVGIDGDGVAGNVTVALRADFHENRYPAFSEVSCELHREVDFVVIPFGVVVEAGDPSLVQGEAHQLLVILLAVPRLETLFDATTATLVEWVERLRQEVGEGFPEKVTAFREGMAVHGRYRKPCPDCGAPVQRIVYAQNEANYCARCQTGGKLLADRALSRLLKKDWPRTLEELERREQGRDP